MNPLSLDWDVDTDYPVTLPAIKQQLRIDHDELDDVIMEIHLPAAVKWAEGEMHRSILSKEHRWVLQDFPRTTDQAIRLPRGKTQSVVSIAYTNNNTVTTLRGPTSGSPIGTDYRETLRSDSGGVVYPLDSETWPDVDIYAPEPVLVTFNAGWTVGAIPEDIKAALIRYIGDALDVASIQDLPQGLTNWHFQAKDVAISGWKLVRWH